MAKDPVCGVEVDEKTAKYKTEHMGKTYYFCCAMCKERYCAKVYELIRTVPPHDDPKTALKNAVSFLNRSTAVN